MAINNITYELGNPADNPSPIEEQYLDEKGRPQYRVWLKYLSTAPTTDGSLVPYVYNGAPINSLLSQGRGKDGVEAVFNAFYDTKHKGLSSATTISEEMEPQQMWIANPSARLYWANGKRMLTREMGREYPLYGWTYILKYENLLSAPSANSSKVGGCIASGLNTAYGALGAETCLFGSPSLSSFSKMGGGTRYGATYRYAYNPNGWNKWWNARAGIWSNLYFKNGVRYIYHPLV